MMPPNSAAINAKSAPYRRLLTTANTRIYLQGQVTSWRSKLKRVNQLTIRLWCKMCSVSLIRKMTRRRSQYRTYWLSRKGWAKWRPKLSKGTIRVENSLNHPRKRRSPRSQQRARRSKIRRKPRTWPRSPPESQLKRSSKMPRRRRKSKRKSKKRRKRKAKRAPNHRRRHLLKRLRKQNRRPRRARKLVRNRRRRIKRLRIRRRSLTARRIKDRRAKECFMLVRPKILWRRFCRGRSSFIIEINRWNSRINKWKKRRNSSMMLCTLSKMPRRPSGSLLELNPCLPLKASTPMHLIQERQSYRNLMALINKVKSLTKYWTRNDS